MPASPVPNPRLLFISNLFPDQAEPWRGLDNATLLHHLSGRWDIRVLAIRPQLPFQKAGHGPRETDRVFRPHFVVAHYVPKFGHGVNVRLIERAARWPLQVLQGQFDVILSAGLFPDACAAASLAKTAGVPFVAIGHGPDVHQSMRSQARKKILRERMASASAIITRAGDLAAQLADAGLVKKRLHTIYNGIDQELFSPGDRGAARRALGLPPDARIVLFAGHFAAIEHPMLLIEAFSKLIDDDTFSNVLLVCAGSGPLEDDMRWRADRDCPDRVVFAGRRNPEGIAACMNAADVLCLPGAREGVPNAVLEAFASGLPVVAASAGGIPEVHREGKLGRLVPPGDIEGLVTALKSVLDELPDRDAIRAHGSEFTWKKSSDACDALLRDALAGGGR